MIDEAQQIYTFADRIFHRADGLDDVVPAGHQPNWKDRPSRFRLYRGVARIALPSTGDIARTFATHSGMDDGRPSLEQLSALLYLTAGPLRRKLDINWNADPGAIQFLKPEYARGSASGGGLYPVQPYVVVASGQQLAAGVYHYSAAEHALVPLRFGDWTEQLAEATGTTERHPFYLVFGVDFWTNCFKYHNFGYHVCSEDAGVMLATVELVCDALGLVHQNLLTFDDRATNVVTGADGQKEGVFAVVAVGTAIAGNAEPRVRTEQETPAVPQAWQRSSEVTIPAELRRVHQLTSCEAKPVVPELGTFMQRETAWLQKEMLQGTTLPSVLLARRSAWSNMRGERSLRGYALKDLLQFVSLRLTGSASREVLPTESIQLTIQANHVDGVEQGAYRWDAAAGRLVSTPSEGLDVWQSTYSMHNYNIDDTACILFVVGRLRDVLQAYGARGYRVLNAYVGMAAQLTYVAAAMLGLDCGAVLGVRAQRVKETLQLQPDENVFLAIYLSEAQTRAELFQFHLAPEIQPWKPVK